MTTPRQMTTMLAAATLFAATAVCSAQTANQPGPVNSTVQEQQAAPIEHAYANQNTYHYAYPQRVGPPQISPVTIGPGQEISPTTGEAQATPIEGVILRVGPQSKVREVSSDAQKLELRVEHGLANVNVHKPAKDTIILVDLPGGQTQILKDGLYTFNAETNTARVLKGEALAFPAGGAADAKPMKVKENNKIVYSGTKERPHEFVPYEASADILPGRGYGERGGGMAPGFGYGPYGDGFYPYYAYGYPGWGYPYYPYGYYPYGYGFYPYGYGFYPYGFGLGFTYFGGGYGFHGGGFRGRR
ncbi:MAG TPA: hypothetical protein VGU25_12265 [Acidobacteriaceae bacterium]|nr:hypothetical protein [Acidobacteriaceae bacterium]